MDSKKLTQFNEVFECNTELLTSLEERKRARLSLAYGQVEEIPREILLQIANQIEFLDLSHNEFKNLSFLSEFKGLRILILDRNYQLDHTTFPQLLKLDTLWINNCNLININDWLLKLQVQCPNLRELSMMCNPVGQTQLNGVTDRDENEYREKVLKMLPQLHYFDGISTAEKQPRSSYSKSPLLNNPLYKKLHNIKELSTHFQRNFKSINQINLNRALLLPIVTIAAK